MQNSRQDQVFGYFCVRIFGTSDPIGRLFVDCLERFAWKKISLLRIVYYHMWNDTNMAVLSVYVKVASLSPLRLGLPYDGTMFFSILIF